ncbi:MAG: hypothetical protein AABX60_01215 [Nanoarchaeota archaeon]
MGLLEAYFSPSPETRAKHALQDSEQALQLWKNYLKYFADKKELVVGIAKGSGFTANRLSDVIRNGLVDISIEDKTEKELIKELEAIEHSKELKRIKQLEYSLNHEETRQKYVHSLLERLYAVLRNEAAIVNHLIGGAKEPATLIHNLQLQLELESQIIARINDLGTFNEFFARLLTGLHVVRRLNAREKRMIDILRTRMSQIFGNELTKGITFQWADSVFKSMEYKVHAMIASGKYGHSPDVDLEFVNSERFVELVREVIQRLRKRPVSEHMIGAFVHLFRELYHELQLGRV